MSSRRKSIPSYLPHKQSGRARAVWTDQTGARRDVLLPGPFNSTESRTAFARLLLELEATPHSAHAIGTEVTLAEVLLAFLRHSEQHNRLPDGTLTREAGEFRQVVGYLRRLYGDTPAATFGPLALKAVRQEFLAAGWCRKLVNKRTNRVRFIFKWAASEQLVPGSVWQDLRAVDGLREGRTVARESAPVGPVALEHVDAVLPILPPHVRGLVELQRLTGCRPGEACAIRPTEVDTTGTVWMYRPKKHKNAHRGKSRTIAIGPRAQDLLKQFTPADPNDFYFSPRRSVAEFHARRTAKRITPAYPSHIIRNKVKRVRVPKITPAEVYNAASYGHAVAKACEKAGIPRWAPNQLRHAFATRVRKEHGLEAAQVLLGHSRADVTQMYAERNLDLAATVAAKIG